ncbi:MAG: L,D-transpeptidase family protein [Smithella sp.]
MESLKINESSQLLIIASNSPSSFNAKIFTLEKKNGKWEMIHEPINGVIGKKGFANPGEKREGDGKSPSGIFRLERVFGYNESIISKMPYRQVLPNDLWIDDVNAIDYNQWVKKDTTQALSYEKLRRNDDLYKYGIVIEYNTNPVIQGYGSAIFLHIWGGKMIPTAGCVAISEDNIIKILGWLDPKARPLIIMGTENEIKRLIQ